MERQTVRDRRTEGETDKQKERQTGRSLGKTDKQKERQTGRRRDRQAEEQTGGETDRETDRQKGETDRQKERQTDRQKERQTGKYRDRQTEGQTDGVRDRQKERQTERGRDRQKLRRDRQAEEEKQAGETDRLRDGGGETGGSGRGCIAVKPYGGNGKLSVRPFHKEQSDVSTLDAIAAPASGLLTMLLRIALRAKLQSAMGSPSSIHSLCIPCSTERTYVESALLTQ